MTLLAVIVAWFVVYFEAIASSINVWASSTTFNHCFFVIPGALYLIWLGRDVINRVVIQPNYWVVLPLVAAHFLGLIGVAGDLQLFQHASAFAALPLLIWAVCGNAIAANFRFPLLFILFSIPIGEELVPFFQSITADMALALLQLVGVPVYRDGLYIEIPGGRFVVAEACSGIRFFVSMIAFGAVYVYLSYHSFAKKCIFMALAVLIPIVANGLRVFGIILVAHLTNMQHAVGADHLVYGWVFQLIVLMLFLGIGEYWRETPARGKKQAISLNAVKSRGMLQAAVVVMALLLVYGVWHMQLRKVQLVDGASMRIKSDVSYLQNDIGGAWKPNFEGASDQQQVLLLDEPLRGLELYIGWYAYSSVDTELISYVNKLYRSDRWSLVESSRREINLGDRLINVVFETITSSLGQKREIAYWYEMESAVLTRRLMVKFYQAFDRLLGGSGAGAIIALSAPVNGVDSAEQLEKVRAQLADIIKQRHAEFRHRLPFSSHE